MAKFKIMGWFGETTEEYPTKQDAVNRSAQLDYDYACQCGMALASTEALQNSVEQIDEPKYCASCGDTNNSDATGCWSCGNTLV